MWTSSSCRGIAAIPERSGPTWPPSPLWRWHLAHCCSNTSLPRPGSPPSLSCGREPIDHQLPIGVGKPAAMLEQLLGPRGDLAVGMGRQRLLLIESQLGEPGRVVLERLDERRDPVGPAQQDPAAPATARPDESLGKTATNACPTCGALLAATASTSPAASSVDVVGVISSSSPSRRPCRRGAQLDQLPRGIDAARLGQMLIFDRRQERRGDLGTQAVERLVAPHARPGEPVAPAPPASARRVSFLSASPVEPSIRAGRSLGQPRATPRRIDSLTAGSPPVRAARKRADGFARAAPGPVLGHAVGDRQSTAAPAGVFPAAAKRLQERLGVVARAAAMAASASHWSLVASPPRSASATATPTSSDGG